MKREILFRGKRVDNGQWIEGYFYEECGNAYIIEDRQQKLGDSYRNTPNLVILGTVGQYTGLCDKNGKKIFEGDIYNQGDKNITYTVVYNQCGIVGKQNGSSSFAGINYWIDRIEVIGNIHDNPELLN